MREVISLEGLDRADWLAARRQGVGSSDAAKILGVSPYGRELDVYAEKITEVGEDGDELMRLGQLLESGIAQHYAEHYGCTVTAPTAMYAHDTIDWQLASPDFWTDRDGPGICEVKNVSRLGAWADGLPEHYEIQAHHQLAVTGLDYVDVAALMFGRELRTYRVERSDDLIEGLTIVEEAFWQRVLDRDPPPVDAWSGRALSKLYAKPVPDSTVELSPEYHDLVVELHRAKAELTSAQSTVDLLENTIKAALADNEVGTVDGQQIVTWKAASRSGTDMKRLRSERPHLARLLDAQYGTKTSYRTLRPSAKVK